jgi:hypothetical protein
MANTRKLHYKDINATASTYTGDLGNIWFDPETNVLRTYTGSPGGKLIGDGTGAASTTGTFAAGTLAGSYYSLYNDGVGYDTYISSKNNDGEVGILSHESAFIKTSWNDADKTWTFGTDGWFRFPEINSTGGAIAPIDDGLSFGTDTGNVSIWPGESKWTFGADGTLTFPDATTTTGKSITILAGNSLTVNLAVSSPPTSTTFKVNPVYIKLPTGNGYIFSGVEDDANKWALDSTNKTLFFPDSGDSSWPQIRYSNDSVGMELFTGVKPIKITAGQTKSWTFGTDGTLTLPEGLQTSSSETLNLFTNYSSGNINIGGISPTINMGSGQVNIGYLNTRIVFGYSGVLTAGTSFTNFTGTPASNGMWTTAMATGTNGNGGPQNGVPVSFTVHGAFGVYNSVAPNFYDQGQNYAVGDTITIAGTQLGGTSPANDLTFTIAGEVGDTYPNLGPGSLVFDYGLGQFFGYTQNTYGTQAYPLWRRLDNTSASSLVNGSHTVSLGTAGTLNLPNFGSTPGAGDGSIGDLARDGNILYFKTSTGWRTVAL